MKNCVQYHGLNLHYGCDMLVLNYLDMHLFFLDSQF